MLKNETKRQLINLFNELLQYACDNAVCADGDTDCDESYLESMMHLKTGSVD